MAAGPAPLRGWGGGGRGRGEPLSAGPAAQGAALMLPPEGRGRAPGARRRRRKRRRSPQAAAGLRLGLVRRAARSAAGPAGCPGRRLPPHALPCPALPGSAPRPPRSAPGAPTAARRRPHCAGALRPARRHEGEGRGMRKPRPQWRVGGVTGSDVTRSVGGGWGRPPL